jgi:hypothetical protein
MSIDVNQLKSVIIVPALQALDLYSSSAVQLILGTAAVESNLGKYLIQQGIGYRGGISIFQIQQNAYDNIWNNLINKDVLWKSKLKLKLGYEGKPPPERMASDLMLAAMMCRLYYYMIPEKLPDADNIPAMASYWKRFYNTSLGKGTERGFIDAYHRCVAKGNV